MKEKRVTKKAILASLLSVVVCSSMLIGTSYAWFTDTATSSGNVIKSGKLDIELSYLDGTTTKSEQSGETVAPDPKDDNADWKDASKKAIFDYDLWEPGYCAVKHIKIANVGNLALKYQFNIIPSGNLDVNKKGHTLADAIDVYYFDPARKIEARNATDLEDATMKATLTEALAGLGDTGSGVLYPEGTEDKKSSDTITLVLKMREDAGNEYQDMDLGTSFAVQVIATQYTYEADSFDDQYDANADTTPDIVMATTPEDFEDALDNAKDGDVIDGNGKNVYNIYNKTVDAEVTIQNTKFDTTDSDGNVNIYDSTFKKPVTFKNCTFVSVYGIYKNKFEKGVVFEDCTLDTTTFGLYLNATSGNVTFKNCKLRSDWCYTINFQNGSGANTLTIDNCDIAGWCSFGSGDVGNLVINDTTFKGGTDYNSLRIYQNATLTNCTFDGYGSIDACANNITVTFTGCTGVKGLLDYYTSGATNTDSVKWIHDGAEVNHEDASWFKA